MLFFHFRFVEKFEHKEKSRFQVNHLDINKCRNCEKEKENKVEEEEKRNL